MTQLNKLKSTIMQINDHDGSEYEKKSLRITF